jgi:hypothetical protein
MVLILMTEKEKAIIAVDSKVDHEVGWTRCEVCTIKVKEKNLNKHMAKVHEIEAKEGSGPRRNLASLAIFLLVVVLIGAGLMYLTVWRGGDGGSDIEVPDEGWLSGYSPQERRGSSVDDWWTSQPDQNPSSGIIPEHPSWVIDKLRKGPVLILTHSEGCMPCITQQEDITKLLKVYGNDIHFVDLLSGSDQKASQTFDLYDPNGSPNYIPLSIVMTLIEDGNGDVRISWHSAEGATGLEWLTKYTKDAIYYHDKNVGDWS